MLSDASHRVSADELRRAVAYYPPLQPASSTSYPMKPPSSIPDFASVVRQATPYLKACSLTGPQLIYQPPSIHQLSTATPVHLSDVCEHYNQQLPSITVTVEVGEFASNFHQGDDNLSEAHRVGRLNPPDPLDWGHIASEVARRPLDAAEVAWERLFWDGLRVAWRREKEARRLARQARAQAVERRALERHKALHPSGLSKRSDGCGLEELVSLTPVTPLSQLHSLSSPFGCSPSDTEHHGSGSLKRASGPDCTRGTRRVYTSHHPPRSTVAARRTAKGLLRRARYNEARHVSTAAVALPSPSPSATIRGVVPTTRPGNAAQRGFRLPIPSVRSEGSTWLEGSSTLGSVSNLLSAVADAPTPMSTRTDENRSPPMPLERAHGKTYRSSKTVLAAASGGLPPAAAAVAGGGGGGSDVPTRWAAPAALPPPTTTTATATAAAGTPVAVTRALPVIPPLRATGAGGSGGSGGGSGAKAQTARALPTALSARAAAGDRALSSRRTRTPTTAAIASLGATAPPAQAPARARQAGTSAGQEVCSPTPGLAPLGGSSPRGGGGVGGGGGGGSPAPLARPGPGELVGGGVSPTPSARAAAGGLGGSPSGVRASRESAGSLPLGPWPGAATLIVAPEPTPGDVSRPPPPPRREDSGAESTAQTSVLGGGSCGRAEPPPPGCGARRQPAPPVAARSTSTESATHPPPLKAPAKRSSRGEPTSTRHATATATGSVLDVTNSSSAPAHVGVGDKHPSLPGPAGVHEGGLTEPPPRAPLRVHVMKNRSRPLPLPDSLGEDSRGARTCTPNGGLSPSAVPMGITDMSSSVKDASFTPGSTASLPCGRPSAALPRDAAAAADSVMVDEPPATGSPSPPQPPPRASKTAGSERRALGSREPSPTKEHPALSLQFATPTHGPSRPADVSTAAASEPASSPPPTPTGQAHPLCVGADGAVPPVTGAKGSDALGSPRVPPAEVGAATLIAGSPEVDVGQRPHPDGPVGEAGETYTAAARMAVTGAAHSKVGRRGAKCCVVM